MLVDINELMRAGLRRLLQQNTKLQVVAESADGRTAVQLAQKVQPDLILLGIALPGLNGLEAARQILSFLPDTRIIFITIHADRQFVANAIQVGAHGYILKSSTETELLTAIDTVLNGRTYITPAVAGDFIESYIRHPADDAPSAFKQLSAREREVLQLLAEGQTSKQIGGVLTLSTKTIDSHRAAIMDKLNIRSIAGLTKYAIRHGLTSTNA